MRSPHASPLALAAALIFLAVPAASQQDQHPAPATSHADGSAAGTPVPPSAASLARGREIFRQECAPCHGLGGRGDGPAAASLRPRPFDLTEHAVAHHSDAELFRMLSGGVPGTAMPAFQTRLSHDDRWHVLNYVKSLAQASGALLARHTIRGRVTKLDAAGGRLTVQTAGEGDVTLRLPPAALAAIQEAQVVEVTLTLRRALPATGEHGAHQP